MTDVWGQTVTVVLHHTPEDEAFEGEFEAITMTGVPHGVSIVGSNANSAEEALANLLDGLRVFGFAGHIAVEDATEPGPVKRYEIEA